MEYSPIKIKQELEKKNFKIKKRLGQNFIIDENIIDKIIEKAIISKNTLVIEIGAGPGTLTNKLGEKAKNVLAYEIDNEIKPVLEKNIYDNTTVIYDNVLTRNINEDIKKYKYEQLFVISNLPYYITTPIIVKLIKDKINIDKIVVMVQKEVGNRFKAKPGSKDYSSLSILLNYYFDIMKLFDVSRNVFLPKPNVDSMVLSFTKKENKVKLKNENIFFKLIRDSFRQKRKTLKNNLKKYDLSKIEEVLKKYNMNLSVRAEAISTDIFVEIANNLDK